MFKKSWIQQGWVLGIGLELVLAVSSPVWAATCFEQASSIESKLSCLPGVQFKEIRDETAHPGVRLFEIQFTQPVDHQDPSAGTFQQKLILHHRGESEPMVLQTSGYNIFAMKPTSIMRKFGTNQLQIEHRFFAQSKPDVLDWGKLDVEQSAVDFHAITVAFKKIYAGGWIGTGASKGGMTSVYHRRFYPDDLDGTVADVAPLSFSTDDHRYSAFLEQVGGDRYAECRAKLKEYQRELLQKRDEFKPAPKATFRQLGSSDLAFEHAVIEMGFYFWQYGNPEDPTTGCSALPVGRPAVEQFAFMSNHGGIDEYTDDSLAVFIPYYFQAATQLGGPDNLTAHLEDLRRYPFSVDQYTPKGVSYRYSNARMQDVASWVKTEGDQILFVYGELDPWTAGQFPVSETGMTVERLVVAGGNHSAKFNMLAPQDQARAVELLTRWLKKEPVAVGASTLGFGSEEPTLEDLEFQFRKKFKL